MLLKEAFILKVSLHQIILVWKYKGALMIFKIADDTLNFKPILPFLISVLDLSAVLLQNVAAHFVKITDRECS
jgi:hypothetical protein